MKSTPYIKELIAQGEHQRLDFKFEITDARKISKTLVAFANTYGGTLLIGVKDNGNIAGVRSDEEFYMLDAAAKMYCKPPVNFEVRTWMVTGKTILEAIISKSDEIPHYAEIEPKKWMAYIRINDENILANIIHLKVWKKQKQKKGILLEISDKEMLLLKYLESNPFISLTKFCKLGMITKSAAENILVNMITLNLIEIDFHDQHFIYRRKGSDQNIIKTSRLTGLI
jgi:predicted HTH transcriptional regulator